MTVNIRNFYLTISYREGAQFNFLGTGGWKRTKCSNLAESERRAEVAYSLQED